MAAADEVVKLQRHLTLLREEYVKLQSRLAESEKKCSIAQALSGNIQDDSFVSRLLKTVAELFDKELYSDLSIQLDGRMVTSHRFVLSARSSNWGVPNLADVDHLDLTDLPLDIGLCLLKWVYTDQIDLGKPDTFLLNLIRVAQRFSLASLMDRCENALLSSVNVRNCMSFFQTADEIGAETLKGHCSQLISNHWGDFTSEDFVHMSAPLLFKMFKEKTDYPLHQAIKTKREDVVFLYLMEYDSQLHSRLNEWDCSGNLPLDLALQSQQESIAKSLVTHGAGINVTDKEGQSLLHRAIQRADEFSSIFLLENKVMLDTCTPLKKETALHMLAAMRPSDLSKDIAAGMLRVAQSLLQHNANPNLQDCNGNTVLHKAIASDNKPVFHLLMENPTTNHQLKNENCQTALWFALKFGDFDPEGYASQLVKKGACLDEINNLNGDSLLHLTARSGLEEAAIFLVNHKAQLNIVNKNGECPLHVSCLQGLSQLTKTLLRNGANPNLQVSVPSQSIFGQENKSDLFRCSPLHLAILSGNQQTIQAIIDHRIFVQESQQDYLVMPNFNLKNSKDQTPLALALSSSLLLVAQQLLNGGSDINNTNSDGLSLLHLAILNQDTDSALFLLENGADITLRTRDNETPLQLAVKTHLPSVVETLCINGADLNFRDENDITPLWTALENGHEDVASILVRHGCDTDCWSEGPGGCHQTLLHRAIDENNEAVASFLIRSSCDINSPRRPSPDGRGEDEANDGQTPLHLCGAWGLEGVVQTLIEHNANVNIQDAEGKTPAHIAIINQHPLIINLLLSHPNLDLSLRDKKGLTPFASAMITKNNKAAEAILSRSPKAAEQYDNKGRNFLHLAIQSTDIESVLFLLSIKVNIHSRLQDSSQLTPLHLATESGSEIIVRNLLLAGANINDLTPKKQTSLHLAAAKDHSKLCSLFLEKEIDFDILDNDLNNALHLACHKGNLASIKILLTESDINAEAVNLRGRNPLHVVAQYGKENASAIFEFFLECMPKYPIDKPDSDGNSCLLLAYMNGNGNLCRSIVRAGARVGALNSQGINIFNFQVASKHLLFRLLDFLSNEPPWCDGDFCMECNNKFGITTRKHHCRHCGRVLCSKCSERDIPVLKFGLNKPVRVCGICFEVLTLGSSS